MNQPLHHDELPLPDYDHLPLGSLESRVRSLDADGVEALLDYEQAHGDRLPVVQVLQRRLEALRAGAEPTGGDPTAPTPGPDGPDRGSQVDPSQQGPPVNPRSSDQPPPQSMPR